MNTDYLLQKQLKKLNPELLQNFRNVAMVMSRTLEKTENLFPYFTDHTIRHALIVIDFFERLIGEDNIGKMNEDEIYILLCAAYMHDFGMTMDLKTFEKYKPIVVPEEYWNLQTMDDIDSTREMIRSYHQLFSGKLIEKYAPFFEIPSDEHAYCIAQVCRGHRKADLFDPSEYNPKFKLPNGNTVCLPYLAALIRLADELDIAVDRNPISSYEFHMDNLNYRQHFAVKHLETMDDRFVMDIQTDEEEVRQACIIAAGKLEEVLQYCVKVIDEVTPFEIHQRSLELKFL